MTERLLRAQAELALCARKREEYERRGRAAGVEVAQIQAEIDEASAHATGASREG